MNVLITSGGTREPIDGVRFITNFSSGTTGAALADNFAAAGCGVTLLRAIDAAKPSDPRIRLASFGSVLELDRACARLLDEQRYDAIIHAAAVSDFVVDAVIVDGVRHQAPLTGKLDSAVALSVELRPSPKILPKLKGYAGGAARLIGFKLTNGASAGVALAAVRAQLDRTDVDFVVHNDLTEMDHGADRHPTTIYDRRGVVGGAATNAGLAGELRRLLAP